ncbi:MAG: FCD domain-containing protein, partial [Mobilitalea sp.]
KISALSLKEMFVSQIRNQILSGQLAIGSRLPAEREIARQMQVSRVVISSGFTELERQGFLEIRQRQGVFVADFGKNGNINTLNAIMEYHGDMLGLTEINSILEVRRALEHLATDLVIENASEEAIFGLEGLLREIAGLSSVEEVTEATFAFHHRLAVISQNSIMPLIYVSFRPVVTNLWRRYCLQFGKDALYDNTHSLYKCIKNHDAEAARRCTDQHMDDAISIGH